MAATFYQALQRRRPEADRQRSGSEWPALYAARQISIAQDLGRWEIEARILARQDDQEIARRCAVPAEAVRWYQSLFFNVRDRLDASDWILASAIGPLSQEASVKHVQGELCKLVGWHSGPLALDVVLAVMRNHPLPPGPPHTDCQWADYDAARLRLGCKLFLAAFSARTDQDLRALMELQARLRRLDRRLGTRNEAGPVMTALEDFLVLAGGRLPAQRKPTSPAEPPRILDFHREMSSLEECLRPSA